MEDTLEDYLFQIQKIYGEERYFRNLNTIYDTWINNVKTDKDKDVLNLLFQKFKFYSKKELKTILSNKLHEEIYPKINLEDAALIPLVPIDGRNSGSNELIGLINELYREEEISKRVEGTNKEIDKSILPYKDFSLTNLDSASSYKTIIIIDDIMGTGDTLEKYIKYNYDKLLEKEIKFLYIAVTEEGLAVLKEIKNEYTELNIELIYNDLLEKVSKSKILNNDEYRRLTEIEKKVNKKGKKFILGYKGSELLVIFSHNVPNNTIRSFWWDDRGWRPLFLRFSNNDRKNRKVQNYINRQGGEL